MPTNKSVPSVARIRTVPLLISGEAYKEGMMMNRMSISNAALGDLCQTLRSIKPGYKDIIYIYISIP